MAGQGTPATHLKYSTITGYFLQDDPDTDYVNFDYVKTNFGLKHLAGDNSKTQWQLFEDHVALLNKKADSKTHYRVLFLGRHGQGVHNVAEAKYGTKDWDCTWSKLEGDGTLYWVDPRLTPLGIEQVQAANNLWAKQLSDGKMPAPQTYYTSPLDRCCHTAQITFSNLTLPSDQPFVPTVKELLREVNGVHTCDKRSTRTYIHTTYPSYVIEPSLTESDELWSPTIRESDSQLDARLKSLLDDIFTNDESTWISLTSHSAAIGSMLRVLGHREFRLKTGAVMPVLVKAETLPGPEPERPVQPGIPVEECVGDETTSYDSVFRKTGV